MPKPSPATVAVTVRPSAKTTAVTFNHGVVYVCVKEPAREGKANEACRKALAKALDVAPSTVQLIRGRQTRVKTFALTTLGSAALAMRLSRLQP